MKEYTAGQYINNAMNVECLILNPAFIEKKPRRVGTAKRNAGKTGSVKWSFKAMSDSGDLFLVKSVVAAVGVFAISLFC